MKNQAFFRHASLTASLLAGTFLIACGGGGGGGSSSGGTGGGTPPTLFPPSFSSASSVSVNENVTSSFYTLSASDPDGGSLARLVLLNSGDGLLFDFNSTNGALFVDQPLDFEVPTDADGNNVYQLTFEAEDNEGETTQFNLAVTVLDVADVGAFGLDPDLSPSENFNLSDWKVQLPINDDGGFVTTGSSDTSDQIEDYDLDDNCSRYATNSNANGIQQLDDADDYSGCESRFFYTGPDGGIVMRAPIQGARTSTGTSYTRTEFREMLRAGDRSISTNGEIEIGGEEFPYPNGNNWAFSSAPQAAKDAAGAVDGNLKVTLAVNGVTTTGDNNQVGRFVMGQIHAADDEPIRLYYRLLPGNSLGSIYMAHERSETAIGTVTGDDVCGDGNTQSYGPGADVYCNLIGSRDDNQSNPVGGIALGAIFSYEIDVVGNDMTVTLEKGGAVIATQQVDMSESGYDVATDYHYFKAGVYQQNNTGDADEYTQVTIYQIENSHD